MALPVLAGFIAYAMAGKPGLAPGLIGGYLAGTTNAGFLGALLVGLLVPLPHWPPLGRLAAQVAALAALAAGVGVVESSMARLRLSRVPLLLVAAAAFPAFGLALTYV